MKAAPIDSIGVVKIRTVIGGDMEDDFILALPVQYRSSQQARPIAASKVLHVRMFARIDSDDANRVIPGNIGDVIPQYLQGIRVAILAQNGKTLVMRKPRCGTGREHDQADGKQTS